MNRAEAKEAYAKLNAILGNPDSGNYNNLPPWRKPPASCATCDAPPARRIIFDGEFLCEQHAEVRLDELCDAYGGSSSHTVLRRSWSYWLRSLYWRPVNWMTYKRGPFRPFMIRRVWCRSGPAQRFNAIRD